MGSGPRLICRRATLPGLRRRPPDAHHLRFAQNPALGRKVSDGFTVPLCRGHHREVHRCGDEPVWWLKVRINPMVTARALWLKTHPLPEGPAHSRVGATEPAASHDRSGQCEASRGPDTLSSTKARSERLFTAPVWQPAGGSPPRQAIASFGSMQYHASTANRYCRPCFLPKRTMRSS